MAADFLAGFRMSQPDLSELAGRQLRGPRRLGGFLGGGVGGEVLVCAGAPEPALFQHAGPGSYRGGWRRCVRRSLLCLLFPRNAAPELGPPARRRQRRLLTEGTPRYRVGAAIEWLTAVVSETTKKLFTSAERAGTWFEAERATSIAIVAGAARRPDYRDTTLTFTIALGEAPKSQRHWLKD